MIFTLLAGQELVEMYSFVLLANKSCFLYTFPISNSILLTWVGCAGQGGGEIGIKIGAQVANQVAARGWQTCCCKLVSSLATSSFLGHLDNFLDRSELLRNLFEVY